MNRQKHIKVFIADDHPVIVQGVKCMLTDESNITIVGVAHSGMELQNLLPKSRPTILLLDINMPGADFYENIAWVKKEAPWVGIIVFSEYYAPDLIKSLFQAGVKGYLSKESTAKDLSEAIHTVVGGNTFMASPGNIQFENGQPSQPKLKDDFRKRLSLSRREQEILELISKGLSSQGIGKTLFISKHTVETHRKNILRKLDFNTSTELVKFAVQQGLV